MEIKELQKPELREVGISIRTYPSYAAFLKKHKISPSVLFNKAIEELMEKENGK